MSSMLMAYLFSIMGLIGVMSTWLNPTSRLISKYEKVTDQTLVDREVLVDTIVFASYIANQFMSRIIFQPLVVLFALSNHIGNREFAYLIGLFVVVGWIRTLHSVSSLQAPNNKIIDAFKRPSRIYQVFLVLPNLYLWYLAVILIRGF